MPNGVPGAPLALATEPTGAAFDGLRLVIGVEGCVCVGELNAEAGKLILRLSRSVNPLAPLPLAGVLGTAKPPVTTPVATVVANEADVGVATCGSAADDDGSALVAAVPLVVDEAAYAEAAARSVF